MKKQLILGCIMVFWTIFPQYLFAQSTEGTDFWVTLMRGDERKYEELSLTFSAKKATKVYVDNTETGLHHEFSVGANAIVRDTLCTSSKTSNESSCYVTDAHAETPVYRALHVTSDEPISLIAANYKDKSFDVAAILPTKALMSEYRIQCYSPSAHENASQGSHFAIVAADDDVVVDITPSVRTYKGKRAGETFTTDTLKKGQVYYVWTGNGTGINYDFSGTIVKARNNKKIAVFNGNSHTNIPTGIRDRDHIFSQAMPIKYWGKRFAITSSLTTIDAQAAGTYWERIDKVRVQALVDGTTVKIDGQEVHTFDFVSGSDEDKHHFYEFDFGKKDSKTDYSGDGHKWFDGVSHYIETSCPCAVHIFMTSDRYDHKSGKYCNGDPSEIWVNPIEQKIKTLTFGTFQTKQVTDHFLNIITTKDNVNSIELDGTNITDKFSDLTGNADLVYTRITGLANGTHTLISDSGFIAHVYGFGEKESYGYPAGGQTKDLTAFVTINGKIYNADSDNKICGDDKVVFGCELNYEYDSIYWYFGDGKDCLLREKVDSVEHYYDIADAYKAYVLIYRHMEDDDNCIGFDNKDSIAFLVNIGKYRVDVDNVEMPYCTQEGEEADLTIHLFNPSNVSLTGDSVSIAFKKEEDGLTNDMLTIKDDTTLVVHLPGTVMDKKDYSLHIHIGSECPNSVLDKDLVFSMHFDKPYLTQRYNNVLGLLRDSFPNQELSNFVWFHDGDTVPNEQTGVLYLEEDESNNGEYYVCFNVHEEGKADYNYCTCPVTFTANDKKHEFDPETTDVTITATYVIKGDNVFVNADWNGKTDIECYAQWIMSSGQVYNNLKFNIPDGGCTIPVPDTNGFYLLRVYTDGLSRSFKFIIDK